ncbi:MAG TPA: methylmalonyl Co-A mutase-associated GTPase MeaB [Anaerolineaceae bacterium]|nr:methylmalonyl Co-A mutase-associated GTPase MeaB [Anaerolineaceae bacterium]
MNAQEVKNLIRGDRLTLSRILSQVESQSEAGRQALEALFPFTGRAHKIGITGAPGAGKSSLVNALTRQLRRQPDAPKVAIIAVDPTSPFSGGALLGDRVRMPDLQRDPGVFIRSMATRGALGGLAAATEAFSQVFDAAGYDIILIETVGAGQAEVEVVNLAHTTIVVDTPGTGDDIQAIKAGILEIADILVINKADRPGADQSVRYLQAMLEMGYARSGTAGHHASETVNSVAAEKPAEPWLPPVLKTIAIESQGIEDLLGAIQAHRKFLLESGTWQVKERQALQKAIQRAIAQNLMDFWEAKITPELFEATLQSVVERKLSPESAAQYLLQTIQGL